MLSALMERPAHAVTREAGEVSLGGPWIDELRRLLHDVFVATEQGVAQPRLARAHGYADGYMKGLLQAGVLTQRELLGIVSEARVRFLKSMGYSELDIEGPIHHHALVRRCALALCLRGGQIHYPRIIERAGQGVHPHTVRL